MKRARWKPIVVLTTVIAVSFVGLMLAGENIDRPMSREQVDPTPDVMWMGEIIPVTNGTAHIQLGDTVIGDVGTSGADTVMVRFNATEGTKVSFSVKMDSLQPTLALFDASGAELDLGRALAFNRKHAKVKDFEIPLSGNYAFKIGGIPRGEVETDSFMDVLFQGAESPYDPTAGRFTAKSKGKLPRGVEFGILQGVVVNELTGEGIPGVEVTLGPYLLVTDANGELEQMLPVGSYDVTLVAEYFQPVPDFHVELFSNEVTQFDVEVVPLAPVFVSIVVDGDAVPGGQLTALAEVVVLDGSTVESYGWTQPFGAPAVIVGADMDIAAVQLADLSGYREYLIHVLSEPPVGPDQLPPHVPLPEGEFPGGLQDRFQVVGMNPFALEEAALVGLMFEVVTTSGAHHAEVEIHTPLPWKPTAGIRNVGVGIPVILHGKKQAAYDWILTAPGDSAAMLIDGSDQNPEFTPDVPGVYEVQVTDGAAKSLLTLEVFAGTWRGVIIGQDDDGRPISDGACTGCHSGVIADDQFTPWAQSGHAEIFSANLDNSTHYGPNCFPCHTVGFDPVVTNDGFDDASDYEAFVASGMINNPGDNWTMMLEQFGDAAQKANIQCENCHGPQNAGFGTDTDAHGIAGPAGEPRTDLSSDVCATCHGEPLRHARFQQWQLSGHADYELAIDESGSGNCSRCHTANGFLTWLPILEDDDPTTDPLDSIEVTWTADEAHAQTCVTCHPPHAVGTTSGLNTDATVWITGDTPPLIAGFTAEGVGSGAMCMTCHNSRRGLRNDANFADVFGTSEAARAPHGSSQTDLLMAQNAYLVEVGSELNHANIEDTCVNCHMEKTPPPDELSYNQGGTNHTFYADTETCARCHGEGFPSEAFLGNIEDKMNVLQGVIEVALLDLIGEQIDIGNTIDLNGAALIDDVANVSEIVFGEARGRQAITVTFVDDTTVGPLRLNDVDVRDGADAVIGQLYDFADPVLIKSGWNYNLIHNDGSRGGHNPTFATQILDASMDALSAKSMRGWSAPRKR